MTNEKFLVRFTSGNGTRRNQQNAPAGNPKDEKQNLKYAIFYLVVAIILFLANRASKHPTGNGNESQSASNLHIDLSVARKLETNPKGSNVARGETIVVRFRLSNAGNRPIFYPVSPGTNLPIGQIVYRIAPGSDWRALSAPELSPSSPAQLDVRAHVAWVEMPPGGWVDGEYEDPGSPAGDHAYELDLRVTADGIVSPLLSHPYPVNAN
jgi:hypothetical protein